MGRLKKLRTAKGRVQIGFKGIATETDEKLLDPSYATKAFNFTFRGGALKGDIGISSAQGYSLDGTTRRTYSAMPTGYDIREIFPYHRKVNGVYDDRLVILSNDKRLYYTKMFSEDTWHQLSDVKFTGKLCAVNYNYDDKDILLVSSENNSLTIVDGDTVKVLENAPKFSSLAVHYERVFGTVNGVENQVWFSSVMNPENWTVSGDEAGYITFSDESGDVEKVMSLSGHLYIFREHSVYRLTAYADQSEFLLKKVFTDTGRIYKDTIAFAGDKIMFYSEDGLFSFDGYDAVRVADFIKVDDATSAIATYHNEKYYLACYIFRHPAEFVTPNNAVVEYDLKTKKFCILAPVYVKAMKAVDVHHATDVLVGVGNTLNDNTLGMLDGSGKVFDDVLQKSYESPLNTLGTDKLKIVKSVSVETEKDIILTVTADDEERSFSLIGSKALQKIPVDMSGYRIGFKIISNVPDANIAPFGVEVEYF